MSPRMPGLQSFSRFLHHFVLAKSATSSIRVESQNLWEVFYKVHRLITFIQMNNETGHQF